MIEEKLCVGNICCLSISGGDWEKDPIILLHGYSFNRNVWKEVGLLQKLEDEKIPFLAIDMPYGIKSECSRRTSDALMNLSFLEEVITKRNEKKLKPVILGASMGGFFAILYAEENNVEGLLLVGPVGTEEERVKAKASNLNIPVLIIVGEKDTIIDLESIKSFARTLPNSQLKIYESSGHPAYLYKKEEFVKDVLSFYKSITV
ncbi:MAG: alpha/beta hydrolase [Fervidicoccaceae archaeon]